MLDLGIPEMNGLEATRQILHEQPKAQVLILTMHESEQLIREVLDSGARGYVLKTDAGDVMNGDVSRMSGGLRA
jgi:DNA-binding NarL/FixJ family response regulator